MPDEQATARIGAKLGSDSEFDTETADEVGLGSCPENGREARIGERPFLENSTACRKSVPNAGADVRRSFGPYDERGRFLGEQDN